MTEMKLSDPRRPSLHWWEKTIEYAFVQRLLPQAAAIALPMAGGPEAALGDLLLGVIVLSMQNLAVSSEFFL